MPVVIIMYSLTATLIKFFVGVNFRIGYILLSFSLFKSFVRSQSNLAPNFAEQTRWIDEEILLFFSCLESWFASMSRFIDEIKLGT